MNTEVVRIRDGKVMFQYPRFRMGHWNTIVVRHYAGSHEWFYPPFSDILIYSSSFREYQFGEVMFGFDSLLICHNLFHPENEYFWGEV